jgi:hypothetical protein
MTHALGVCEFADGGEDGAEGVWIVGVEGCGLEVCADEFEGGGYGCD